MTLDIVGAVAVVLRGVHRTGAVCHDRAEHRQHQHDKQKRRVDGSPYQHVIRLAQLRLRVERLRVDGIVLLGLAVQPAPPSVQPPGAEALAPARRTAPIRPRTVP